MAEVEQHLQLQCSPRVVNLLSAITPSMEGLFLPTVLDGKTGIVALRYHDSQVEDVKAFCNYLQQCYGEEVQIHS